MEKSYEESKKTLDEIKDLGLTTDTLVKLTPEEVLQARHELELLGVQSDQLYGHEHDNDDEDKQNYQRSA